MCFEQFRQVTTVWVEN